ncbi:MAG: preprotein translocase subunit YajC [Oscillospiraceae bacterium]|jgi:preprotein translocase subunit YajC|nr:preprotein translocase subunit YajC [Oscillospiraceae bacterium]
MNVWNWLTRAGVAMAEGAGDAAAAVDPAAAEEAVAGSGLVMLINMLPLVLIVVVMYFLMIRPQRKKDKKVKEMLSALKVGDRVTTIGGVHGTIMGIKDDTITLGVGADKTKLVFARWAIREVDEVSISNDSEALV